MRIDRAADLLRAAREDVGMSQSALASAAGMQQPTISAYESGRKQPRGETLARLLRAARVRPSIPLALYADDILRAAERHHLTNVRVFGSAVRGQDHEDSDIDLLVSLTPDASLFDLGGFAHESRRSPDSRPTCSPTTSTVTTRSGTCWTRRCRCER